LVKITPGNVYPTNKLTGTVTFDVTSGDSKVKVWKAHPFYPGVKEIKDIEISLPETYNNPADMPKTFYVEGIEPSGGPRDVEFTLTYIKDGLTFEDKVKVTVVHVELFKDEDYTQTLDDWPKQPGKDYLRSPKYMFGKKNPIYVQVKNIGINPDLAEPITDAVAVISQSSDDIYLDLKETGVDTQIFRNSEADTGELLYLSTEDSDDFPDPTSRDTVRVIDEKILNFWLRIPPSIGSLYKRSEDVMVDRAEIGVEWQKDYNVYCSHLGLIPTDKFGEQLFDNIGGEPGLVWYKNFDCNNLESHPSHWKPPFDTLYADAVDMTSWSGHASYDPILHFFTNSGCISLHRAYIDLGDKDAEWVIFDTCWFLDGSAEQLKTDLLSSNPNDRSAHMFLGFAKHGEDPVMTYWKDSDCGEYFAQRLKVRTIQQAWFDYCEETQFKGCKARVFRPIGPLVDYSDESLAGPGPIEVLRDPIASDDWRIHSYLKITPPDPPL
jgi:hypothetical protein